MSESKYYVWCKVRDLPTREHASIDAARTEARRLATENPEIEFMVVRAIEMVKYTESPYRVVSYCRH